MKKTIIMLLSVLLVSIAKAETKQQITIINNGKAGGSFHARTLMYRDGLVAAGYEVNYEDVGKISQAVKMFKETDRPTVMVYSNNQVFKQELFHTADNFIMLEYQQPLYVCQTNESKNKTSGLTVAHGKGYDTKLLNKVLGDDIVLVPYKNSSAMLKGILGGDVDMMVNNQGMSFKYMDSGKGKCEPSNLLPTMQATVIGTNVDVKQMREVMFDITMDIPFLEYHNSRQLNRPSNTWENELAIVKDYEKQWRN